MKPRFRPCKPFLQIYRRIERAPVVPQSKITLTVINVACLSCRLASSAVTCYRPSYSSYISSKHAPHPASTTISTNSPCPLQAHAHMKNDAQSLP